MANKYMHADNHHPDEDMIQGNANMEAARVQEENKSDMRGNYAKAHRMGNDPDSDSVHQSVTTSRLMAHRKGKQAPRILED